jgi:hypothetical protein
MRVVCPVCGGTNSVVPDYEPGSVLACNCGAYLEFVRSDEPPRVLPKEEAAYSASRASRRAKPEPADLA